MFNEYEYIYVNKYILNIFNKRMYVIILKVYKINIIDILKIYKINMSMLNK